MKISYESFTKDLDKVGEFIDFLIKRDEVLGANSSFNPDFEWCSVDVGNHIRDFKDLGNSWSNLRLNFKIYDYNGVLICVYGIFEGFFRSIVSCFIREIFEECSDYSHIPKKILDAHFSLSLELARKSESYGFDKENIIKNLSDFTSGSIDNFNFDAIFINGGNLKHGRVCELLSRVGVDFNNNIYGLQDVRALFDGFFSSVEVDLEKERFIHLVSARIDDMVERRNEIAHGSSFKSANIISLLDVKLLFIDFMKIYGFAIWKSLDFNNFRFRMGRGRYHELTVIHNVYNNSILCFELAAGKFLKVGDDIFVLDNNENLLRLNVESIEVNGRDFPQFSDDINAVNVGCKLNGRIKRNYKFFLS